MSSQRGSLRTKSVWVQASIGCVPEGLASAWFARVRTPRAEAGVCHRKPQFSPGSSEARKSETVRHRHACLYCYSGGKMRRILTEPPEEMLQPSRFPLPASRIPYPAPPGETLPGALVTRHSLSPELHAKALESAYCRSGASDLETTESSSPKPGPHFSQIWKSPRGHVGFPLQQVWAASLG